MILLVVEPMGSVVGIVIVKRFFFSGNARLSSNVLATDRFVVTTSLWPSNLVALVNVLMKADFFSKLGWMER